MTSPSPQPVADAPRVKPFAAFLQETNGGRTHNRLGEQLHELIEAVLQTGKAGSLTLTVKVDPDDVDSRRLLITETTAAKLPVANAKKSVFWADGDNNLVRTDPDQLQFGDLRDAGTRERNMR